MGRGKIERETKREKKKGFFTWEEHKKEESSNKDYCKREKREYPRKRVVCGEENKNEREKCYCL